MLLTKTERPLFESARFADTKDPCPVFDGTTWHIFGSGGDIRTERWEILHATARSPLGPWKEEMPVQLIGIEGEHIAAPGVYFDATEKRFHMFVQKDFLATGEGIHYLTSDDGNTFFHEGQALAPIPDSGENGLYDPHPAVIAGKKYIVYSGTPLVAKSQNAQFGFVSKPDIYLAESVSNTWAGPWKRVGKILDHEHISDHHNQRDHADYEWGIEGPQLLELPNGQVLLNATCFLPDQPRGRRQRVFFATANSVTGPYKTLGPVVSTDHEWEEGENGHAAATIYGDKLVLFYQGRHAQHEDLKENKWRYGVAEFDLASIS